MVLGYEEPLYILAFDHRGSFQKKMFGISGEPTPEETTRISDAKRLIFEGMLHAADSGEDPSVMGVLVDEQFGGDVPAEAKRRGLKLAMPVERSGQDVFDFEFGEEFGAHIERFDPDFAKVLVRYNPEGDEDVNAAQLERLQRLSRWLRANERRFLFELLVPATESQLARVDGDTDRYDVELRADLMVQAVTDIQDADVEPDIWKIEGLEERVDCERVAAQCRSGGRDQVACVLLGRGADDGKVDQWLTAAAGVEGFVGFAIGRSIWWDPLKSYLDGSVPREKAAAQVGENYLRFMRVYREAL